MRVLFESDRASPGLVSEAVVRVRCYALRVHA